MQIERNRSGYNIRELLWRSVSVPLLILLFIVPIFAQTFRGTILGTVTDQGGLVIQGAKITAKNVDTGVERSTITNGAGDFAIPELPIGNYQITVEKDGFQTASVGNLTVEIAGER